MLEDILNKIDVVFRRISEHKMSTDLLLGDANSLSTLMYNLGDLWVAAREDADRAETKYKDAVEDRFIELIREGETQGKAEVYAKHDNRELRDDHLNKLQLEQKLNILRRDVDKKISVLQSYASELRSQRSFREIT